MIHQAGTCNTKLSLQLTCQTSKRLYQVTQGLKLHLSKWNKHTYVAEVTDRLCLHDHVFLGKKVTEHVGQLLSGPGHHLRAKGSSSCPGTGTGRPPPDGRQRRTRGGGGGKTPTRLSVGVSWAPSPPPDAPVQAPPVCGLTHTALSPAPTSHDSVSQHRRPHAAPSPPARPRWPKHSDTIPSATRRWQRWGKHLPCPAPHNRNRVTCGEETNLKAEAPARPSSAAAGRSALLAGGGGRGALITSLSKWHRGPLPFHSAIPGSYGTCSSVLTCIGLQLPASPAEPSGAARLALCGGGRWASGTAALRCAPPSPSPV